jgi:hypothetical protein
VIASRFGPNPGAGTARHGVTFFGHSAVLSNQGRPRWHDRQEGANLSTK